MKTMKNKRMMHAMTRMVTITHLIPTFAAQGVTAKTNAVLKVFRTTVTPTKASPIIYHNG